MAVKRSADDESLGSARIGEGLEDGGDVGGSAAIDRHGEGATGEKGAAGDAGYGELRRRLIDGECGELQFEFSLAREGEAERPQGGVGQ